MSSKLREACILVLVLLVASLWAYWPRQAGAQPSVAAGAPIPRMRVANAYRDIERNVLAGRKQFSLSLFGEPTNVIVLSATGQRGSKDHYHEIKVHQQGPWGAAIVTYELESADGTDNILRVQIRPEPSGPKGGEDFLVDYPDESFLYDSKRQPVRH